MNENVLMIKNSKAKVLVHNTVYLNAIYKYQYMYKIVYICNLYVYQIYDTKLYLITLPDEKQTLFTFVNSLLIVKQYHEEKRGE